MWKGQLNVFFNYNNLTETMKYFFYFWRPIDALSLRIKEYGNYFLYMLIHRSLNTKLGH